MINLDFKVSRINLLFNCMYIIEKIKQSQKLFIYQELQNILTPEELELLRQICFEHEFNGYTLAYGLNNWAGLINDENYKEQLENLLKDLNRFAFAQKINGKLPMLFSCIEKICNAKSFQSLYARTCKYRDGLKERWDANKNYISNYIESITGKVSDETSIVMVEAPIVNNGSGFEKSKHILFSRCHNQEKENTKLTELLELVYLTHESMHSHFLPYMEGKDENSRKKLHRFYTIFS